MKSFARSLSGSFRSRKSGLSESGGTAEGGGGSGERPSNLSTRDGSFRTASSGGGIGGGGGSKDFGDSTIESPSPDGLPKPVRATKAPIKISTKASAEDDSKRMNALAEIESSERTYLNHIQSIPNLYMPAIKLLPDLEPKAVQLIEGNIKEVVRLAEQFLEGLEKGESSGIPFGRVYTTYTLYCDEHMKRQEVLKELCEYRTDLVETLERVRKENKVLSFDSLIIMPIQRLPRYVLLLQEVVKRTPPTHPDYNKTKKAMEDVTTLANTVNKSIKFVE